MNTLEKSGNLKQRVPFKWHREGCLIAVYWKLSRKRWGKTQRRAGKGRFSVEEPGQGRTHCGGDTDKWRFWIQGRQKTWVSRELLGCHYQHLNFWLTALRVFTILTHTSFCDGSNYSSRKSGTRQKDKKQPAQIAGRMISAGVGKRFLPLTTVECVKGLLSGEIVMDELIRAPAPVFTAVTRGA